MGDRLTLEQRRVVASLMEVYGSPTVVSQKVAERFAGQDAPSRVTIYRVLLLPGYCVLHATAKRLRPSCKSSCTYHVCFVNKWFLHFKF